MSLLCEHFGYTVTQALWELYGVEFEQAPAGLHWTILQMRAYAQAKDAVDRHARDSKVPLDVTPTVREVWEIMKLIGEEKRQQKLDTVESSDSADTSVHPEPNRDANE